MLDIAFEFEDIAPGGCVGLIALATDYNSETDLRRIWPAGVDMFTNRVLNNNPVTLENLRAMAPDITRAAQGILPNRGVDAMIYGCTSGVAAIGEERLTELIHAAKPGVPCTNPIAAATAALEALHAKRISVLTPYTESVNAAVADAFGERGFDILNIDGFGLDSDVAMTELPVAAIAEAASLVLRPDADALFISCTATRAAQAIEQLEAALNLPVVTSNQALVWHCLQLLGNDSPVTGFGRLLAQPRAACGS